MGIENMTRIARGMGKGQVTLFMITGVVLIIILVTFLIVVNSTEKLPGNIFTQEEPLTPLQLAMKGCVEDATKQALLLSGMQGGYPEIPVYIRGNPAAYVPADRGRNILIPYWLNGGVDYSPSQEQIEAGVSAYISKNVQFCLDSLNLLEDFSVKNVSAANATFMINDNDVTVEFSYKALLETETTSTKFDSFRLRMPVKLKEMLAVGKSIMQAHATDPFFARQTIDLMAIDANNIPMANIDFRCGEKRWRVQGVTARLQDLLQYNIPRMRVKNTNHVPFQSTGADYARFAHIGIDNYEDLLQADQIPKNPPSDLYEFQHYYWDAKVKPSLSVTAGFRYLPSYGMTLVARPSDNGVLSSQYAQGNTQFLSFMCLQVYKFTYDVSYPVEVVLVNEQAFETGESFVLRFALPVMIEKNIPQTQNVQSFSSFGSDTRAQFCSNTFGQPINIYVEDISTREELEGVDILYDCGGISCNLGKTTKTDNGAVTRLIASLPSGCFGGTLLARSEHTLNAQVQWDNIGEQIVIPTHKVVDVPVRILLNPNNLLPSELTVPKSAFITVKNDRYSVSELIEPGTYTTIRLLEAPATYNVTVSIYNENNLAGGYIGQLTYGEEERGQTLYIHALEEVNYPQNDDEILEFYQNLQRPDTFIGYYPEWR